MWFDKVPDEMFAYFLQFQRWGHSQIGCFVLQWHGGLDYPYYVTSHVPAGWTRLGHVPTEVWFLVNQ